MTRQLSKKGVRTGESVAFRNRYIRTLDEHREAVGRRLEIHGSTQVIIDALADAISDVDAAVAVLLDLEVERQKRERKKR